MKTLRLLRVIRRYHATNRTKFVIHASESLNYDSCCHRNRHRRHQSTTNTTTSTTTTTTSTARTASLSSLLHPMFRHLSPSWGAVIQTSPLLSNVIRMGKVLLSDDCDGNAQDSSGRQHQRPTPSSSSASPPSSPFVRPCKLARSIFFQTHRGSAIRVTRSRSMAAAHLTPDILGTITGISILLQHRQQQLLLHQASEKQHFPMSRSSTLLSHGSSSSGSQRALIRKILKDRHDIKSNHVNGEWTGVSLARWIDLVENLRPLISNDNSISYDTNANVKDVASSMVSHLEQLLSSAIWSVATYQLCPTHESQMRYLVSIHETLTAYGTNTTEDDQDDNLDIWDVKRNSSTSSRHTNTRTHVTLDKHTPRQNEWINNIVKKNWEDSNGQQSKQHTSKAGSLKEALKAVLIDYERNDTNGCDDDEQQNVRMDNLLLAIINERSGKKVKPVTPNSYFAFDGGDPKPDCVEVCVRELLDYLLWDEESGSFDTSRLPKTTAIPTLFQLYSSIEDNDSNSAIGTVDDAHVIATSRGQEWFDMLSDIPTCQYLSTSPNGVPYELTPTLRNVAKVMGYLLVHKMADVDGEQSQVANGSDGWDSLSKLQKIWTAEQVQISFETLTEKGKMTHELIVHEIANISIPGRKNVIELRLRMDWQRKTGFATVTHFRLTNEPLDALIADRLLAQATNIANLATTTAKGNVRTNPIVLGFVALSLLGEVGLLECAKSYAVGTITEMNPEQEICRQLRLVLSILSSRYGSDRRNLMSLSSTTDLEREERAYDNAFRDSRFILKNAIVQVCDNMFTVCADEEYGSTTTGSDLLLWLLSESPEISSMDQDYDNIACENTRRRRTSFVDSSIERRIVQLPESVVHDNDKFFSMLDTNWAVRGQLLRKVMAWNNNKHRNTLAEIAPTFWEIPGFVSLVVQSSSLRRRSPQDRIQTR